MTIESDKFYEKVCHSFNICLNDKLLRRSKGREALSRRSDRYRHHKVDEVVIGTVGENFHLRTFVSGVFGFAELQENGIYGLKHTLFLRRNKVQALLNRVGWTDAEVEEKCLSWNVPPYTPVEPHDAKLTYHSKSKAPIESRYIQCFGFSERCKRNWLVEKNGFTTYEQNIEKQILFLLC